MNVSLVLVALGLLAQLSRAEEARGRPGIEELFQCPLSNCTEACPEASRGKSRKKRTVFLPNATFLSLQSRLIVPQVPIGLYIVWIRVRFVVRSMFTEQTTVTGDGFSSVFGRSFDNVLTRTLADDQVDILKRMEQGLSGGGLPGRECILRAICELKETPIHEWSLVGEMISTLFFPKSDNHTSLEDYQKAAQVGADNGECWSVYSACPLSIFNVIPDVYTKDHKFNVSFDNFDAGTNTENKMRPEDFADLPKSFGASPSPTTKEFKLDFNFT